MNKYVKFRIVEKDGKFALQGRTPDVSMDFPVDKPVIFGLEKFLNCKQKQKEGYWEFAEAISSRVFDRVTNPDQYDQIYEIKTLYSYYVRVYNNQIEAEKGLLKYMVDNLVEPTSQDAWEMKWNKPWQPVGKL